MKKLLIVLVSLSLAVAALAQSRWITPAVVNYNLPADGTVVTNTFTNAWGSRVILQSLWLSGPVLTNASFTLTSGAATNDLPTTALGSTVYYESVGSITLEADAVIKFIAANSATNNHVTLKANIALPE